MFRKRKFWENVGESLGKGEIFDKTLRELLGRRVDEEFYEREEELKETEKMIRCYEEAISMEIQLLMGLYTTRNAHRTVTDSDY